MFHDFPPRIIEHQNMMKCRLAPETGYAMKKTLKGLEEALRFRQGGLCVSEKWVRVWIKQTNNVLSIIQKVWGDI